jgi:hypothetical protein
VCMKVKYLSVCDCAVLGPKRPGPLEGNNSCYIAQSLKNADEICSSIGTLSYYELVLL